MGRVLHEDDDFIMLELGKRDDVEFHFQLNESGDVVGGDRFYSVVFVHNVDGGVTTWVPWQEP